MLTNLTPGPASQPMVTALSAVNLQAFLSAKVIGLVECYTPMCASAAKDTARWGHLIYTFTVRWVFKSLLQ